MLVGQAAQYCRHECHCAVRGQWIVWSNVSVLLARCHHEYTFYVVASQHLDERNVDTCGILSLPAEDFHFSINYFISWKFRISFHLAGHTFLKLFWIKFYFLFYIKLRVLLMYWRPLARFVNLNWNFILWEAVQRNCTPQIHLFPLTILQWVLKQ